MNRHVMLLGVAVASLMLATGSGSFSAMSADRDVEISVVDDENAYLAIQNDEPLRCGNPPRNTLLRNQFDATLDSITAEVSVPAEEESALTVKARGADTKHHLSPGESAEIAFEGAGDGGYDPGEGPRLRVTLENGTTPDSLGISISRASGVGVTVSVDERTFDVDCSGE